MSLKNNHYRAVTNYRRGERHRWVTCLAASRVVGNYAEGETVNLAKDLGVSTMHVGRMAKAGMAYRMFRRYNPGVRGEVASPKHFYTMWDLWQEFEFSPREQPSSYGRHWKRVHQPRVSLRMCAENMKSRARSGYGSWLTSMRPSVD